MLCALSIAAARSAALRTYPARPRVLKRLARIYNFVEPHRSDAATQGQIRRRFGPSSDTQILGITRNQPRRCEMHKSLTKVLAVAAIGVFASTGAFAPTV